MRGISAVCSRRGVHCPAVAGETGGLSASTRWALAVGCAVSVSNLYYLQPLLAQVAADFRVSEGQAGLAATLSQVGYGLGILTIVPLGDIRERRALALTTLGATTLLALAMATAPSFPLLCVASLLLGVATCTPQLLVPFAATLARSEERGRTVGFVMSGLLLGILLARTASGFVSAQWGWRAVYLIAAVLMVGLAVMVRALLPESRSANEPVSYGRLLRSLGSLVRDEPVLRESAIYGACLFGAFSAFWTTLSFHLAGPPFDMGPKGAGSAAGLFGLVGAAGALAAPLAGRMADQGGPRRTIAIGILVTLASFGIMLAPSIAMLVVGVLLMDVGVQATQISNQSRVYSLRPEARNRLNTVYMTVYFVGGSLGSALGAWAWGLWGWPGVCGVGAGFALLALTEFFATRAKAG
ncbi:MFS transporter [bacterium]|nr:MAG: MFS transporter [bacterium]